MASQLRMHQAVEEVVTGNIVFRHKRPLCGESRVPRGRMTASRRRVTCDRCKRIAAGQAFQVTMLPADADGLRLVDDGR